MCPKIVCLCHIMARHNGAKRRRMGRTRGPPPTPPSARKQAVVKATEDAVALEAPRPPTVDQSKVQAFHPDMADAMAVTRDLTLKRLHVGLPPAGPLPVEKAKQFADDLALRMLPDAMAEVAWQLHNGDAKDRAKAVEQVLDMNNMRRRDLAQGVAPTIILNLGGGNSNGVPWLTKEVAEAVVVKDAAAEGDDEDDA